MHPVHGVEQLLHPTRVLLVGDLLDVHGERHAVQCAPDTGSLLNPTGLLVAMIGA
jgi:hypothetical protein